MIFIILLNLQLAWGAPIPLTSSSIVVSESPGIFRSPIGFSIHAADTGWDHLPAPKSNSYIATIYKASEMSGQLQAALTVRVDKLPEGTDLSAYSRQWMRDYPRLGFEILSTQRVRVGSEVGHLIDLVNRSSSKQLRQILFLRDRDIVTLTCRDDVSGFSKTLQDCNKIIRTFRWI